MKIEDRVNIRQFSQEEKEFLNVTTPAEKAKLHFSFCEYLNALYRVKNHKYGDSFRKTLEKYGPVAALVRMDDKFERIKELLLNPGADFETDESVYDTLLDLANYCIMSVMEMSADENLKGNFYGRS